MLLYIIKYLNSNVKVSIFSTLVQVWKQSKSIKELWNSQPYYFKKLIVIFQNNFRVPEFYEYGINFTPSDPNIQRNAISDTGAFIAYSGAKTG